MSFFVVSGRMRLGSALGLLAAVLPASAQTVKPSADRPPLPVTRKPHETSPHVLPGTEGLPVQSESAYYRQQRAFPNTTLDPLALLNAGRQRDRMPAAPFRLPASKGGMQTNSVRAQAGLFWESVGPVSFGSPNISGRVNQVAFSNSNPLVLYAATAKGGIWKTVDGGNNWTPQTDNQFGLAFNSVAVDPYNANIVYAGTGDYERGEGVAYGMLKSTDGGQSWVSRGAGLFGTNAIRKILINPLTPSKLFIAAGKAGLFRSTDGGETFTKVYPRTGQVQTGSVSNVVYDPFLQIVYTSVDGDGIYEAIDGGDQFTVVAGAPNGTAKTRLDVAVSNVDQIELYVLDVAAQNIQKRHFDPMAGTISWGTMSQFPPLSPDTDKTRYWKNAAKNATILAVGGNDSLLVGMDFIFACYDNYGSKPGDTMTEFWSVLRGNQIHVGQHGLTQNPNNIDQVAVANDGGVFISPDDGQSFASKNRTLNIAQITSASYTADGTRALAGVAAGGSVAGATMGNTTSWQQVAARFPLSPVVLPFGQSDIAGFGYPGDTAINSVLNTQFASWANLKYGVHSDIGVFTLDGTLIQEPDEYAVLGFNYYPVFRTTSNWAASSDISLITTDDVTPYVAPLHLDVDPTYPGLDILFLGTNYLNRWDSASRSWYKFPQEFSAAGYISAITSSPNYGSLIAFGTSEGNVWFTYNGGVSFVNATGDLPTRYVAKMVYSPNQNLRVYAVLSGTGGGHIYRCDDISAAFPHWENISGSAGGQFRDLQLPDIYTSAFTLVPTDPTEQLMFVGNDLGAFYSYNGGQSWYNATAPFKLPNVPVTDLSADTRYVRAATGGRGLWRFSTANLDPTNFTSSTITVTPFLQGYRGNRTRVVITVSLVVGNSIIASKTGRLSAGGSVKLQLPNTGQFDVLISAPGFLTRRVRNYNLATGNFNPIIAPTLYAGDVDGDNAITANDYAIVQSQLGAYTTSSADVDGDGRVTSNDLAIIQINLGRVGDQ